MKTFLKGLTLSKVLVLVAVAGAAISILWLWRLQIAVTNLKAERAVELQVTEVSNSRLEKPLGVYGGCDLAASIDKSHKLTPDEMFAILRQNPESYGVVTLSDEANGRYLDSDGTFVPLAFGFNPEPATFRLTSDYVSIFEFDANAEVLVRLDLNKQPAGRLLVAWYTAESSPFAPFPFGCVERQILASGGLAVGWTSVQ